MKLSGLPVIRVPVPCRPLHRAAVILPVKLAALLLLILSAACSEDPPVSPSSVPPAGYGRIHGRLLGGAGPFRGTVKARAAGGPWTMFQAESDTTGQYLLLLPFGNYTLRLTDPRSGAYYTRAGLALDHADRLTVSPETTDVAADLVGGTIRVRVHWPASMGGRQQTCWLEIRHRIAGNVRIEIPESLASDIVFEGLPAGWAQVRCSANDGGADYSAGIPLDQRPDSVEVVPGRLVTVETTIPEPCTVEALWRGSWVRLGGFYSSRYGSSPVASLEGYTADSTRVWGVPLPELPGTDGSFSFRVFGGGRVRIRVVLPDTSFWLGGPDYEQAPFFDLRPGETLRLPDIVEAGLLGHLDPGVPIAGFSFGVDLLSAEGDSLRHFEALCGDCGGPPGNVFFFAGLRPGRYLLRFRLEDSECACRWVRWFYPGVPRIEDASAIELQEEDGVAELDWALTMGGTISGLSSASGEYVARLYAAADTSAPVCVNYRHDGSGAFRFSGLEDGDYLLKLQSHEDGLWYPGRTSAAQAETLRVRNLTGPEEIHWPWR